MPFKAEVNQAMLRLKETNQLQILKNKWWKKSQDGACDVSLLIIHCPISTEIKFGLIRLKMGWVKSDWLTLSESFVF